MTIVELTQRSKTAPWRTRCCLAEPEEVCHALEEYCSCRAKLKMPYFSGNSPLSTKLYVNAVDNPRRGRRGIRHSCAAGRRGNPAWFRYGLLR